jgi:hypothetical protein
LVAREGERGCRWDTGMTVGLGVRRSEYVTGVKGEGEAGIEAEAGEAEAVEVGEVEVGEVEVVEAGGVDVMVGTLVGLGMGIGVYEAEVWLLLKRVMICFMERMVSRS